MTLLAFAAERRIAVDTDQKAAAPAADAPCSNRLISPACGARSSKPAAAQDRIDYTDEHRIVIVPARTLFSALLKTTLKE